MRRLGRTALVLGTVLGAAVGFVVSSDPVGLLAGAGAGAGVGLLVGRRRSGPRPARIDPFTLQEPWRRSVQDALKARSRYREALGRAADGPVRDRLLAMGARLDEAVETCWEIARHGQTMADARRRIDVRALEQEASSLRDDPSDNAHRGATAEALEAQLATAGRLDRVLDETRDHLRLLNARLDETVARSTELATRGDQRALGPLGTDVGHVADELESLRLALDEADDAGGPH